MTGLDEQREVTLILWPGEPELLTALRTSGRPRLLLISANTTPPDLADPLEDWVRLPVESEELEFRLTSLRARAALQPAKPLIDDSGLLRARGQFASLSRLEERLTRALLEHFEAVVPIQTLLEAGWPNGLTNPDALKVHISILRRKLLPLGLAITAARGRGYIMKHHVIAPA
jgi:DNA-binding response OmpR family regulator